MPYNHTALEQRLSTCDNNLFMLFSTNQELDSKLKQDIKAVQDYYQRSYTETKSTSAKTIEAIATSYEAFVQQLTAIKNGQLSYEEAVNALKKENQNRTIDVIFKNLAKACELLFWLATTFSLYAGVFGLALPMLVIEPCLGIALAITIGGAMLAAAAKAFACCTEFNSISRVKTQYTYELALVSFFKPAAQEPAPQEPAEEKSHLIHEDNPDQPYFSL